MVRYFEVSHDHVTCSSQWHERGRAACHFQVEALRISESLFVLSRQWWWHASRQSSHQPGPQWPWCRCAMDESVSEVQTWGIVCYAAYPGPSGPVSPLLWASFHTSHLCKSRLTLGLGFQHASYIFCCLSQTPWYHSPTTEMPSAALKDLQICSITCEGGRVACGSTVRVICVILASAFNSSWNLKHVIAEIRLWNSNKTQASSQHNPMEIVFRATAPTRVRKPRLNCFCWVMKTCSLLAMGSKHVLWPIPRCFS